MFWADSIGLATIVDGLERYRDRLGADFSVAASIRHGGGWDIRQSGVLTPVGPSPVLAIDPLEGTDR